MLGNANLYDPITAPTLARDLMMAANGRTGLYRSNEGRHTSAMHQEITTSDAASAVVAGNNFRRTAAPEAVRLPRMATTPTNPAPARSYRRVRPKTQNA